VGQCKSWPKYFSGFFENPETMASLVLLLTRCASLLDDEEIALGVRRKVLEEAGYVVFTAATVVSAGTS